MPRGPHGASHRASISLYTSCGATAWVSGRDSAQADGGLTQLARIPQMLAPGS
jgi:hypothetical protein